MRGHIVQRSKNKGTWSIIIELDKDPATGKRRQKWVTFQGSHAGAKKQLTELLLYVDAGERYLLSNHLSFLKPNTIKTLH